jgi:hypothetical protein
MDIYFIGHLDLDTLKANVSENLSFYQGTDKDWIIDRLGHDPFIIFKKPVEAFELDPKGKEIDNSRTLYKAMASLSDSEATDERIWAGLSHSICWDYMRESLIYEMENNRRIKMDDTLILNRYFFNMKANARKRSMYINGLSKLWWAARLCYDHADKTDPFHFLELFETAFSHKLINTYSSNYMANETIRFSVFEAASHIKSKGYEIKADTMVPMLKYLNELGGRVVLDIFSREELTGRLIEYVEQNIDMITGK